MKNVSRIYMDSYTLEYLETPIIKKDTSRKSRSFDWAISRTNETDLEPANSIVFLAQSYQEARLLYDTLNS